MVSLIIKVNNRSEKVIENEVSSIRVVSQWKLIRDRGQISQEIQHLLRYYKEVFMSKEKSFETQYVGIDEWGSEVKVRCLNRYPPSNQFYC